jgi:hypothetical protein
MRGKMRTAVAVVAGLAGFTAAAAAQVAGMPLFTNPRYGNLGLRVHADLGRPTDTGTGAGDLTVVQGGANFVLGPIGIDASVGMLKDKLSAAQGCVKTPDVSCSDTKVSLAALAQYRLMGGGMNPLSLSVFGGASMDITALDAANYDLGTGSLPKELTIPVGAAVGFHTPFGLNVWGAPRLNFRRWINCDAPLTCENSSSFRWAIGADMPILGVLSLRAAFDSGKLKDLSGTEETVSFWGVGASIGLGGMR